MVSDRYQSFCRSRIGTQKLLCGNVTKFSIAKNGCAHCDAVKSVVQNHILSNFCVGVVIKFKNFDFTEFEIKFAIDCIFVDFETLESEISQMF